MFEEFLRRCRPVDGIKPSKKRVQNNINAVKSLIEKEENTMPKRKIKFKPLIIAAVIAAASLALLITVNAAPKGRPVEFVIGGKETEGECLDYVDRKGYRRVSFGTVVPFGVEFFAMIYDVDAPKEEALRIITPDTDPEFLDNLQKYLAASDAWFEEEKELMYEENDVPQDGELSGFEADTRVWGADPRNAPQPEDFGIVLKTSEICSYDIVRYSDNGDYSGGGSGTLGGDFLTTGTGENHPSGGGGNGGAIDYENKTFETGMSFYYYVGKE